NLLLFASVGSHSPDLHMPGALGVEVNVIPVGRIFRTIVQSLGGRQLLLLAACRGNRVDIEIAVPLADERKCLSIRRPAMPIRRRLLRDASRRAATHHAKVSFVLADRKSTRLNSSHEWISYAVFCLKKKKNTTSNMRKLHKSVNE